MAMQPEFDREEFKRQLRPWTEADDDAWEATDPFTYEMLIDICREIRKHVPGRVSDETIKSYARAWLAVIMNKAMPIHRNPHFLARSVAMMLNSDGGVGRAAHKMIRDTGVDKAAPLPLPPPPVRSGEEALADMYQAELARANQLKQKDLAPIDQSIKADLPPGQGLPPKRRGRPPGSKNKKGPKGPPELKTAKVISDQNTEKRLTPDGKIIDVLKPEPEKKEAPTATKPPGPGKKEKPVQIESSSDECSSSSEEESKPKPKPKSKPKRKPKAKSKPRTEISKARAKANAWWKKHPRAKPADKRRTAKRVVKKARSYVPRRNDFRGVDTKR